MARLALGVVGGVVGAYFGQPGIGFAIGSAAGNYLFPEDLGTTEGPRLDDRQVMAADEGTDMPFGWGVIPVPGQILWADEIRQTKTTIDTGGKGSPSKSEYKEFSYSLTFAVSFGYIETDHIRRLWFNGKIVVDNRLGSTTATKAGLNYSEYLGTQTQEPDASIEAIVGTGNAPAYRGQTYIVFRNLPLADYNNAPPSIVAELVTSGTAAEDVQDGYIWENCTSQLFPNMDYDQYSDTLYYSQSDTNSNVDLIHKIDPYTGNVIQNFESGFASVYVQIKLYSYGLGLNNRIARIGPSNIDIWNTETGNLILNSTTGFLGSGIIRVTELSGYLVWTVTNFSNKVIYVWSKSDTAGTTYAVDNTTDYTATLNRSVLGLTKRDEYSVFMPLERNADNNPAFCVITPSATSAQISNIIDLTMPDAEAGRTWQFRSGVYETINNLIWWDVYSTHPTNPDYYYWIAVDPSTGSIEYQITSTNRSQQPNKISFFNDQTQSIWYWSSTDQKVYRLNVVTLELTGTSVSWTGRPGLTISADSTAWYHNSTNRVLMYGHESNSIDKDHLLRVRLDNVTATDIPVSTIVTDVCADVNISASQIDVTSLSEVVKGYRVMRRASARSILEPVLNAKQIDVVQSDYKLKFVPRGGASALTINGNDLGCADGDAPSDLILSEKIPQAIDLPKSIDLQYISSDRDLQPGSVRAMWAAAGRERALNKNLSLVMDDDEATALANVMLQEIHETREYAFTLPPAYDYLEPTDIVTVTVTDTYNVVVKLVKTNRSQDGLQCEAVRVDSEHLNTNVVGGGSPAATATISGTGTPQIIVLDGPLLRDVDNDQPGPYIAAYTYGGGFSPSGVYVSTDGLTFVPSGTITSEPLVGIVPSTPTTGIDWEDYDTTNTVVVTVIAGSGSFSTTTEAQLLAGANVAAWGRPGRWEIVQWLTATDNGDGTYNLDDLLRGRRGTNRNADLHEANDLFVVLNTTSLVRLINAVADIGNTMYYRIVPEGQPISNYPAASWTVGTNPLLPYCPINVTGTDAGGGTLQIDWTRRTRRGGYYAGANNLTDQVEGSISEDAEEYELDIYDSADLLTVVRSVTGLSSTTYDYTSAQWTADGFVSTDTIVVRIYQISATVDRGTQSDDETLTIP